jgi:BolA protein
MTLVKRHQAVYKALGEVMNEIHALSMHLYDLKEFKANPEIIDSPDCVN